MIFSSLTLKYLYEFKTSMNLFPSVDLLTLILDNSVFVDIHLLEFILFSYKSKNNLIFDLIKTNFRKYKVENRWILISINFSSNIADIVWKNRNYPPVTIGIDNNIIEKIDECNKEELKIIYEKLNKYENKTNIIESNDLKTNIIESNDLKTNIIESNDKNMKNIILHIEKDNFITNFDVILNKILNKVKTVNDLRINEIIKFILKISQNAENIKILDFINIVLNRIYDIINEKMIKEDVFISKKTKRKKSKIGFNSEPDLIIDFEKNSKKIKNTKKENNLKLINKPIIKNILNFKETKINCIKSNEKYIPLDLSNAFFIYNRNNIIKESIRKRDDLVNPVKLQIIKFFDQKRPVIYKKKEKMLKTVYSYKKLKEILSYDKDSSEEWELNNEEGISCDEITESEECDEDSLDENIWIENDSTEIDIPRNFKKPFITFDNIKIQVYFEEGKYKNANLIKSTTISDNLLNDIKNAINNGISKDEISLKYNVILNQNISLNNK